MELIHSANGDIIIHYGVKGMKWGVRHDRQYTGSPRKKGFFSRFKKKPKVRAPSFETFTQYKRDLVQNKRVKKVYDELEKDRNSYKESLSLARKFNNDKNLVVKWQTIAAKKAAKKYGYNSEEEIQSMIDAFVNDDADQGDENSFCLYLHSRGVDPKKYEAKVYDAEKKYKRKIRDKVAQSFSDVSENFVANHLGQTVTMNDVISDAIFEKSDFDLADRGYYLWK